MTNSVLVSGATGFLGSLLCERLINGGKKVVSLIRDSSSINKLQSIKSHISFIDVNQLDRLSDYSFEFFFHVATNYGKGNISKESVFESNLHFPTHVINQLLTNNLCRRIINIDTLLPDNISTYAESKSLFREFLIKTASKHMTIINLKSDMFFGFKQHSDQFVSNLIHTFLQKKPFVKLTFGEQYRYVIHVQDYLNIIDILYQHSDLNKLGYFSFDVIPDTSIQVKELVLLIKNITSNTTTECQFGSIPYRENELFKSIGNNDHLKSYIGDYKLESLSESLAKVVKQYEGINENILQR
jgi:CDP-paratose synthetase